MASRCTYLLRLQAIIVLSVMPFIAAGQISNARERIFPPGSDTLLLDTTSVMPGSLIIRIGRDSLTIPEHRFDWKTASVILASPATDTVFTSFRVLPFNAVQVIARKDTSLITRKGSAIPLYYSAPINTADDFLGGSTIQKSGSISRGIQVGNAQNLSVNSTLNLQLSGKITEQYSILASIADDNIPIQPQGNTQQLQDFDQVFIQVFDERNKLIAGDFTIRRPKGYFMNYMKRSQGAYAFSQSENKNGAYVETEVSASVSKGRFARFLIQGIEGNQGPYRLRGNDGELFIVVLAGTEQVYIDGKLLERGQDKDYVIDYNAAEIHFTARQLITKDRRIVVEFQYSDKRYARPMITANTTFHRQKSHWYINVFSENDAKNQPLQQQLTDAGKAALAAAGDNILAAGINGIDSVGYDNTRVLYALRDSLGYDSVLVYSTNSAEAWYSAVFSYVGEGNGDYVEGEFSSNGRTYSWVAPDTIDNVIIHRGSFAPLEVLFTPRKRQMAAAGNDWRYGRKSWLRTEFAVSNHDLNTFSSLDDSDNVGFAQRIESHHEYDADTAAMRWKLVHHLAYEHTDPNFVAVERFRAVEFERNWNIAALALSGHQHIADAEVRLTHPKRGTLFTGGEGFLIGQDYRGGKAKAGIRYTTARDQVDIQASALRTEGPLESTFIRHKSDIWHQWKHLRIGFRDEREDNRQYVAGTDSLRPGSYGFYDWELRAGTPDSSGTRLSVFYRDRIDLLPDSSALGRAARADHFGMEAQFTGRRQNKLRMTISNRKLRAVNSELFTREPENTLLGRVEYAFRFADGAVSGNSFYEIGSGLEQRREFVYLQVPPGQGVYVWNDYNADGVKDLSEFEIAQFAYEADYIRVFLQSDDYIRTYTTQWTQSLQIDPYRKWKDKSGIRKVLSRFSDQFSFKIDRKTSRENEEDRFNPLLQDIADSVLISLNSALRNVFFFNKTNPVFGSDFTWQVNSSKALLANGFESREDGFVQLGVRWSFTKDITLVVQGRQGEKTAASDFLSGRNFNIGYLSVKPNVSWQPDYQQRYTLKASYTDRRNHSGTETSSIAEIGAEATVNTSQKGSLQMQLSYLDITYTGQENSSLGFEMLEGLSSGDNFTWTINLQRNLTKNLQLSIQYNGRKPGDFKTIHSGGIQARAIF